MTDQRKEKSNKLTCRVHTRITKEKYDELNAVLDKSRNVKTLSELLRTMLDEREIVTIAYDNSLDEVMEQLSRLHKELQAIGVNINQVTHSFHKETLPDAKLYQALEIARLYQQTDLKVTELFSIVEKLSEQWLPE